MTADLSPVDDVDALVERLRKFWREVTEDDGGESPQMVMTREAADTLAALKARVERLQKSLREQVLGETGTVAWCDLCDGEWKSAEAEQHHGDCDAALEYRQ